jgi:hypothetical protein
MTRRNGDSKLLAASPRHPSLSTAPCPPVLSLPALSLSNGSKGCFLRAVYYPVAIKSLKKYWLYAKNLTYFLSLRVPIILKAHVLTWKSHIWLFS